MAGAVGWADLDDNLRACVLLHLQPRHLVHVGLSSRAMAREADGEAVWATLFLRRFGHDFWGEDNAPHPYHGEPVKPHNPWADRLAIECYAEFQREVSSLTGNTAHHRLIAFAHQHNHHDAHHGDDHARGGSGWKEAYKRMHEAVSAWQAPSDMTVLVAGQASFGRLNAIMDLYKRAALTIGSKKDGQTETAPLPVDVRTPSGECRIVRTWISDRHYCSGRMFPSNFCVLRRPRCWWRHQTAEHGDDKHDKAVDNVEHELFRGAVMIRKHFNGTIRMLLVYVIDCEQWLDDGNDEPREAAFRELHGLLGEGKGQYQQDLCVVLHLIMRPDWVNADIMKIRDRLKIPLHPPHDCPDDAGRVIFYVTAFTMPPDDDGDGHHHDEQDGESKKRELLVKEAYKWLLW